MKYIIIRSGTNKYYHTSNPINRDSILRNGLLPKLGDQLLGDKKKYRPSIFLTKKSGLFDSTWDDDIWEIDTKGLKNRFFKDKNYDSKDYIYTLEPIPKDNIRLVYKGSGKDKLKPEKPSIIDNIIKKISKKINLSRLGVCNLAIELITKELLKHKITDFKITEGYVSFKDGLRGSNKHTWIIYKGMNIDPTIKQFENWGADISTVKYRKGKLFSPEEYLEYSKLYPIDRSKFLI